MSEMANHTRTWPEVHNNWTVLLRRASNAQLAINISTPALEDSSSHERARVGMSCGDGNDRDACEKVKGGRGDGDEGSVSMNSASMRSWSEVKLRLKFFITEVKLASGSHHSSCDV